MNRTPAAEQQISALYGLVLAGGKSKRMRSDKAALKLRGRSQLRHTYELLSAICARAFVSIRAEQSDDDARRDFPQIHDRCSDIGPVGGILSAQLSNPQAAWLVVACDLPLLDRATLEYLVQRRNPRRIATAYRSWHDGLPEPLCAIWEPHSHAVIHEFVDRDIRCPRKILIESETELLRQPRGDALINVNTPEDLDRATAMLGRQGGAAS